MIGDLTTIDRAKSWLAPDQGQISSSTTVDQTITRLVTAVSRLALNYMRRDTLARASRQEVYRSSNLGMMLLRSWPVLSVESLTIAPSVAPVTSFDLEPVRPAGGHQRIYLRDGLTFRSSCGPAPIGVSYTTGFLTTETLVTDSSGRVQLGAMCLGLVSVMAGTTSLSASTVDTAGVVTTSPAQATGTSVTVTYSFVPGDIEQAVINDVGIQFRGRGHLGESTRAMANGGGTVSFTKLSMSPEAQQYLDQYRLTVQP